MTGESPSSPEQGSTDSPPPDPSARGGSRLRIVSGIGVVLAIAALGLIRLTDTAPTPVDVAVGPTTTTQPPVALADRSQQLTPPQLAGLHFTDVTARAGLSAPQSNRKLLREASMTSGAAVADVNGDGRPDIFLTRIGLPNLLYLNRGDGTFSDATKDSGLGGASPNEGSGAAAFADVNADGCIDLYVAPAGAGVDQLFINDCNGRFRDESAARGITIAPSTIGLGAQEHGVTFADINRDGHLDLLVAQWDPALLSGNAAKRASDAGKLSGLQCSNLAAIRSEGADRNTAAGPNRSRMYLNDGNGHFTDSTAALGLPMDQIAAFTPQFMDIDGDGWDDLLVTGDFCTSRIFHNNQGRGFTDVTAAAQVATDENAMGSVVRDVNGDGRPDWFVTSIRCARTFGNTGCSGNRLYLNRGDGTFVDRTDRYGVRHGWWGWGAAIEDFGDDGRLEIAQTNGFLGEAVDPGVAFTTDPMRLWVPSPTGALPYRDAARQVGLRNTAAGHALIPFDYNGDGSLDLLVANFGSPPSLYRNDRPRSRAWLTIRLDDPTHPGNRAGIGARVVIRPGGKRPMITGWITTSGSYESQRPAEFHAGFGAEHAPLASIEVWWPGATTPQTVRAVATSRVLTITRG